MCKEHVLAILNQQIENRYKKIAEHDSEGTQLYMVTVEIATIQQMIKEIEKNIK